MRNIEDLKPPVAKVIPQEIIYNGKTYKDDYAWLKQKENPEVISYLEEENKYTEKMMEHTKSLQETLYKEMLSRIKETDINVPEKFGEYYYYSRTEEGKQYGIYCRKHLTLEAEEQVLLDLNELAKDKDYLSLGLYKISPDHNILAYSLDEDGSENYILYFKDLTTGKIFEDRLLETSTTAEWLTDSKTFIYTTLDSAQRPFKAFIHKLGDNPEQDQELYHEKDEAFYVNVAKSNNNKYIFLTMVSKTTSEVYYSSTDPNEFGLKLAEARIKDVEYYMDHKDNAFFVVTNANNSYNFKVMKAPLSNPSKETWQEYIPHRDNVRVDFIHVFKEYLIIYERENGLKNIRVIGDTNEYYIDFPEPVYNVTHGRNRNFDSKTLRFSYSSLKTPESVFDFNLETKERELKKQYEVLGGYNSDEYECERVYAPANDSTLIPISLLYKKGMVRDGSNPLYLYGYGSYEISIDTKFSSNRLSLVDRGFIFAIAHIRGGGDMGRMWYENGKFLKKKNTFTDFVNCAEYLVKEKYTSEKNIVAMGGSAGGLLMGAVVNLKPEIFKVAVAHVPFVDVVNTMMDPTLPLTVIEYDEWGNPNEQVYFDYMLSYSPYDNVEAKEYPNLFVTGGLNDPRVGYWEPAKWVAKLRKTKTDNNLLLMKINMGAGHGGASGRYDYLKEIAEEYAFIIDVFGLN